jgi:hypothetical protein
MLRVMAQAGMSSSKAHGVGTHYLGFQRISNFYSKGKTITWKFYSSNAFAFQEKLKLLDGD